MRGIDRFDIADVVRLHGIEVLRERAGENFAVCPFCGDARGKFSFIVKKGKKENLFKCWHCGESGNALDLHIKLSQEDYSGPDGWKRAAKDILTAVNGDGSLAMGHYESRKLAESAEPEAERAGDEACSRAYMAMLRELVLEDAHRADLRRRGLTDAQIDQFMFRSLPKEPWKTCRALTARGICLDGVPGFYRSKNGKLMMKLPKSREVDARGYRKDKTGYFCPVFDGERDLVLGFQIRLDDPGDGAKYLWFSSSGKKGGTSSGAIATSLPGTGGGKFAIVTEGILKATAIYCLLDRKVTVLGVPGVKSIKSLAPYLGRREGGGLIFEAYDMDKAIRTDDPKLKEKTEALAKDRDALLAMVSDYGFQPHPMKWDMDADGLWRGGQKGLDDFLASYGRRDLFIAYLERTAEEASRMGDYLKGCA